MTDARKGNLADSSQYLDRRDDISGAGSRLTSRRKERQNNFIAGHS